MAGRAEKTKRRALVVMATAAALPFLRSREALADKYWKNGVTSGSATVANNWSAISANGFDTGGVPGPSDIAYIENTDGLSHVIMLSSGNFNVSAIEISAVGTGLDTFIESGATTLIYASAENVGTGGTGSTGVHQQLAGTNYYTGTVNIGYFPGTTGTYSLTGGAVNINYYTGFPELSVGVQGNGIFNQSAGNVNLGSSNYGSYLELGADSTGRGSYTLSGGNFTMYGYANIGDSGTGTFNEVAGAMVMNGALAVGNASGSSGAYNLSGGSLTVNTTEAHIGTYGSGVYNQSGGIAVFNQNLLFGVYPGSTGTGFLSGNSSLSATGIEFVGWEGNGSFNQTGGSHQVNGNLVINENGASATYLLSNTSGYAGLNVTGSESVDVQSGTATFNQSGGTHTINSSLYIGNLGGSNGTYLLSGGSLAVGASASPNSAAEYIGASGTGKFMQTGGTNTIGTSAAPQSLYIGYNSSASGNYTLSGNALLTVNGGEYVGELGAGTFNQTGGTHNIGISGGNYGLNLISSSTGIYLLSNSTGTSTLNEFGQEQIGGNGGAGIFNQSGGTHTIDNALYIGAITGGTGTYVLTGGSLISANQSAGSPAEYVGYLGSGSFIQTGGSHTVATVAYPEALYLGYYNGNSGTYTLSNSASSLIVNGNEYVGYGSGGTFNQTNGSHFVSSTLYLGFNAGSTGNFLLSGGGFNASNGEFIGYNGSGGFVQTGGSNFTGTFNLAQYNGSSGNYALSGGNLGTTYGEIIGAGGGGYFVQSGGTNTVASAASPNNLTIASGSVASSYVMNNSAAVLTVYGGETIGEASTGVFAQYAGTHSISQSLYVGFGGTGTFNLGGGSLSAGAEYIGYYSAGTFNQSGGTNTIGSGSGTVFVLGESYPGTYTLSNSGSTLLVNGKEYLGYTGNGTFIQNNGTHSLSLGLYIGISAGGTGTYVQYGGALNTGSSGNAFASPEIVGYGYTGSFNQSGGADTVGTAAVNQNLFIGAYSGATGSYLLNNAAATLLVNGNAYVGGLNSSGGGVGVLNIGSGSATVTGILKLWNTSGSSIALTGGSLSAGSLDFSNSASRFSWTAGNLAVTSGPLNVMDNPTVANTINSLNLVAGQSLSVNGSGDLSIGYQGSGTVIQNGGTIAVQSSAPGVTALNLNVGIGATGAGTYTINSGTSTVAGGVYVGGSSTTAGNGVLTLSAGGSGNLVIRDALNIVTTNGIVKLQGGSISTGSISTNGYSSNFQWTAGTLTLTNSSLNVGTPTAPSPLGTSLSLGAGRTLIVASNNGENIGGTLTQTGGTNSISGNLAIGLGGASGNYSLGSGNLTVGGTESIGAGSAGSFLQLGGSNSAPVLLIGAAGGSSGTYTLAGGNLNLSTGEYVGGSGVLNQTGGVQAIGELGIGTASGIGMGTISGSTIIAGGVGVGGTPLTAGGIGQLTVASGGSLNLPNGVLTVFDNQANQLQINSGGTVLAGSVFLQGGVVTIGEAGQLRDTGTLNLLGGDSPTINISSDNSSPGKLFLNSDVNFNSSSGTGYITSTGTGTMPGIVDLGGVVRTFNVPGGSPVGLSVSASLVDGSIIKILPGVLQLAGSNTFSQGTFPAINVSTGTLQLGGSSTAGGISYALGGAGNTTYVSGVATLDLNGWNVGAGSLIISGMGVGLNGALINSSIGPSTFASSINLSTGLVSMGSYGNMTLSGNISGFGGILKVGSDTLNLTGNESFSDGINLSRGTLSLTGSNSFTGGIFISSGTLAVSSDQALGDVGNSIILNPNGTLEAIGSFVSNRTFTAAGGAIKVDSNLSPTQTLTITSGGIVGAGSFYSTGTGILRLTTTSSFSGALTISNGTFSLSNSSGALPSVASIDVRTGGILALDSSTSLGGNQTSQNRISDIAPIVLDGGAVNLLGADSLPTTELFLSLNVSSGSSSVQVFNGSGGTAQLMFNSLVNRNVGATVAFNGSNLGMTSNIFINSGVTSGVALGGWATVNGTDFAKYSSSAGVIPFTASDYSINNFSTGANVYLDPSAGPVPASVGTLSIATLNINASAGSVLVNQTASATPSTLTFTNSGLIKSGAYPATISGGVLTSVNPSNSSAGELDVLVSAGTLSISSQLSGAFVLTERGGGTLQLDGSANNSFSGVTLVSGFLQLNNSNGGVAIPGNLIINGGLVTSLQSNQLSINSNVIINAGEWNLNGYTENINSLAVYGGEMLFNHGTLNASSGVTLAGGTTIIASNLQSGPFLNTSAGATSTVGLYGVVQSQVLSFNASGGSAEVDISSASNNSAGEISVSNTIRVFSNLFMDTETSYLSSVGSLANPGVLNLSGNVVTTTVNPYQTFVVSTQISNGGLYIGGGGVLKLAGTNGYTLGTTITAGTTVIATAPLALGAAGSTVTFSSGGPLELRSDAASVTFPYSMVMTASSGTIDLNVTTPNSNGSAAAVGTFNINALSLSAGLNSLTLTGAGSGTLSVGTNNTSSPAVTLVPNPLGTAGPALVHAIGANLLINGQLGNQSGSSIDIVKDGQYNALTLAGSTSNAYGNTTINSGGLVLAKTGSAIAVPNNLSLYNGSSCTFTTGSNQISPSALIIIDSTLNLSALRLNGFSNTFAGIYFNNGGTLTSASNTSGGAAGTITLAGDVNANYSGGTSSALIDGNLSLGSGGTHTFNVSGGQSMLNVSAGISSTGNVSLIKTGAGLLYLASTASTFAGTIYINQGTLEAYSNASLGALTNPIVINGGTLLFANSFDPGALTLNAAGTLDTGSNVVPSSQTISGATLTKMGAGTLMLGGNNTFDGLVIGVGSVQVSSDANFGAGGFPVTLAGGGLVVPTNFGTGRALSVTAASTINASTATSLGMLTLNNLYSLVANLTIAGGTVNFNQSSTPQARPTSGVLLTIAPGATVIDAGVFPFDALGESAGGSTNVSAGLGSTFAVVGGSKTIGFLSGSASLNISSGSALVMAYRSIGSAGSTLSSVGGLTLAGNTGAWASKLDLNNNDLVAHNGSLGQLTDQIKSGYFLGTWRGAGGITSSAAATNAARLTSLGVIQNSVTVGNTTTPLYGVSGSLGMFDGNYPAVSSDVLIRYTYVGDANLDGKVDISDYSRIDVGYLSHATGWFNGDFNYDGVINGSDYTLIDNAYNTQGAVVAAAIGDPLAINTSQIAAPAITAVPEPASLELLGVGALGLLGRVRRRR